MFVKLVLRYCFFFTALSLFFWIGVFLLALMNPEFGVVGLLDYPTTRVFSRFPGEIQNQFVTYLTLQSLSLVIWNFIGLLLGGIHALFRLKA